MAERHLWETMAETSTARPRRRRVLRTLVLAIGVGLLLAGCASDAPYDTLEPQSEMGRDIDTLFNWAMIIATGVFVGVFGALGYVIFRNRAKTSDHDEWADPDEMPKQTHGNTPAEIGWTIAPAVVLAVLAVPTVSLIWDQMTAHEDADITIEVYGAQWWWEFRYRHGRRRRSSPRPTPSCSRLVRSIDLQMTSYDVIHSFWIPALNGKRDVAPGRIHDWNDLRRRTRRLLGSVRGVLRAQSHAN